MEALEALETAEELMVEVTVMAGAVTATVGVEALATVTVDFDQQMAKALASTSARAAPSRCHFPRTGKPSPLASIPVRVRVSVKAQALAAVTRLPQATASTELVGRMGYQAEGTVAEAAEAHCGTRVGCPRCVQVSYHRGESISFRDTTRAHASPPTRMRQWKRRHLRAYLHAYGVHSPRSHSHSL